MTSSHEITVFPHDFRVKPVIALANITRYHFDEKAAYWKRENRSWL